MYETARPARERIIAMEVRKLEMRQATGRRAPRDAHRGAASVWSSAAPAIGTPRTVGRGQG